MYEYHLLKLQLIARFGLCVGFCGIGYIVRCRDTCTRGDMRKIIISTIRLPEVQGDHDVNAECRELTRRDETSPQANNRSISPRLCASEVRSPPIPSALCHTYGGDAARRADVRRPAC